MKSDDLTLEILLLTPALGALSWFSDFFGWLRQCQPKTCIDHAAWPVSVSPITMYIYVYVYIHISLNSLLPVFHFSFPRL